jgi:hypothetical protein
MPQKTSKQVPIKYVCIDPLEEDPDAQVARLRKGSGRDTIRIVTNWKIDTNFDSESQFLDLKIKHSFGDVDIQEINQFYQFIKYIKATYGVNTNIAFISK